MHEFGAADLKDGELLIAIAALVIAILVVVPQLLAIARAVKDKDD